MSRFFELVDNPLFKALAGLCCGSSNFAVKLRRKTEVELTGVRFIRVFSFLPAVFKIFFNDGMKNLGYLQNSFTVKAYDIACIYDPANENAVIKVGINSGNISFIGQHVHGVSPVLVSNSLTSLTA